MFVSVTMLKSKIHRATITDANVDYEGSITIDNDLLENALIMQYEKVEIYNITNGERFSTYAIKGEFGPSLNGEGLSENLVSIHRIDLNDLEFL